MSDLLLVPAFAQFQAFSILGDMLALAYRFNQYLSKWDIRNEEGMSYTFFEAQSLTHIFNWKINSEADIEWALEGFQMCEGEESIYA